MGEPKKEIDNLRNFLRITSHIKDMSSYIPGRGFFGGPRLINYHKELKIYSIYFFLNGVMLLGFAMISFLLLDRDISNIWFYIHIIGSVLLTGVAALFILAGFKILIFGQNRNYRSGRK